MQDTNSYPLPTLMTGFDAFFQGFRLPFQALRFFWSRPRYWLLVAIPFAINLIIFTLLIIWGFHSLAQSLSEGIQGPTAWYWSAFVLVIKGLFWVIVLFIVYLIFTPIALLVSAPFNDYLAELTERACGFAKPDEGGSPTRRVFSDALYAIGSEIRRLFFCGFIFLLIFSLNILPLIGNILYLIAAAYWAWRCLAYEFISYASDRRRISWEEKWRMLRRHWPLTLGFGIATMLLLFVPFLNVLMVPICAVAGTMMFGSMKSNAER